jgi:hydroxylamine reductase
MFCYQCEQTCAGTGCNVTGVCGKNPETSDLQDLIIYLAEGVSVLAKALREKGVVDRSLDRIVLEALFTTVTNVNFDPQRLRVLIAEMAQLKSGALTRFKDSGGDVSALPTAASFVPACDSSELEVQARAHSILKRRSELGDDVTGLQELLTYGLKGAAAYAHHAAILGQEDEDIYAYFHEALAYLATDPCDIGELTAACLRCGEVNLRVMELLDAANTGTYGNPEPTKVRISATAGKAILVSGHDLKDLEELLKQTVDKGINIYTHGEMLPALAYPGLKKYPHLVGNYGGAWQDQAKEFDAFPGAILMTTNCIQKPRPTYQDRIFTCGLVAWPDVTHIADRDFTPVINAALAADGFAESEDEKTITIGFGHNAVLSVADTVIDAVRQGAIRHFFLVGGCDGAKPGRNYYTELALKIPADCMILTLACGKYRFNKLDFGEIGGIPRLLDIGQCNDAYSAIKIALALSEAFDVGVNDLPLSMILSWYEQKAVVILLTLLHLGIKGIRLGPTLPAFITPAVLKVLVDNFEIAPVTTPEEDLQAILG